MHCVSSRFEIISLRKRKLVTWPRRSSYAFGVCQLKNVLISIQFITIVTILFTRVPVLAGKLGHISKYHKKNNKQKTQAYFNWTKRQHKARKDC